MDQEPVSMDGYQGGGDTPRSYSRIVAEFPDVHGSREPVLEYGPGADGGGGANLPSKPALVGLVLITLTIAILFGVAEGTRHWLEWPFELGGVAGDLQFGLWRYCVTNLDIGDEETDSFCDSVNENDLGFQHYNYFLATRAASIIALIAAAVSFLLSIAVWWRRGERFVLGIAVFFFCLAALAGTASLALFATWRKEESEAAGQDPPGMRYGSSYSMMIAGVVFATVSAFAAGISFNSQHPRYTQE